MSRQSYSPGLPFDPEGTKQCQVHDSGQSYSGHTYSGHGPELR